MAAVNLEAEYAPDELQRKLREAGKNTAVNQQKVNRLQGMILGMRSTKQKYEDDLRIKRKLLTEKNADIAKVQGLYDETKKRMEENTRKANNLRTQLSECSKFFQSTIKLTRTTAQRTTNLNKTISTNLTSGEMECLRGYSCKPGSTYSPRKGSLGKIAQKNLGLAVEKK